MKKISCALSLAALFAVGCSTMESGLNVANDSQKVAAFSSTDQVQVFVSKNDKTMYRMCGNGYNQSFIHVGGIAPGSVTLGHSYIFEFDSNQPNVHNHTGQSWHIGDDGNPWRVEARLNNVPGWKDYPIRINGNTLRAIDIATTRNATYGYYNTFVIGSLSVNGSNIYQFDRSTDKWIPYSSNINASAISCDQYDVLWCVASGKVYQNLGGWVLKDSWFTVKDIGCGFYNTGIFVISSDGKLYHYMYNTWQWVTPFNNLGKSAKRISVANETCAISTTNDELYYVKYNGNSQYEVLKATIISDVNDVAIKIGTSN